jgi:hypothetical protein
MHLNEYQELAARTLGRDRTHEQQLANAALGLTGEAGETPTSSRSTCSTPRRSITTR